MEIRKATGFIGGTLLLLTSAAVNASLVAFEDVTFLEDSGWYTDPFEILSAGTYKATLTDMELPLPFLQLDMAVTTSTEKMGSVDHSGYFTFDAEPGWYYMNLLYKADYSEIYDKSVGLVGLNVQQLVSSQSVSAVPLPGSGILMGSALVGLAGAIRRSQKQTAA